jgi:hypothetical protein
MLAEVKKVARRAAVFNADIIYPDAWHISGIIIIMLPIKP